MRRLYAIFIALSMLSCSLASLQVFRCVGQSCGGESRVECSAEKSCSKPCPQPQKDDDGQKPGRASCCFVCGPGCCCYLVPTAGFQLPRLPEETMEKPHGLQHRYPRPFHLAIWRPPAKEVKCPPPQATVFT